MDLNNEGKRFEGVKVRGPRAELIKIDSNPNYKGTVVSKDAIKHGIVEETKFTSENKKTNNNGSKESDDMANKEYVTKEELKSSEEKMEYKIRLAVQPLESKIDNLPTVFENLLLKEREHQSLKQKETIRWIVGTAIALVASVAAVMTVL